MAFWSAVFTYVTRDLSEIFRNARLSFRRTRAKQLCYAEKREKRSRKRVYAYAVESIYFSG